MPACYLSSETVAELAELHALVGCNVSVLGGVRPVTGTLRRVWFADGPAVIVEGSDGTSVHVGPLGDARVYPAAA